MNTKRHIEHYKGFHIVAAFFRNEFQAIARHKFIDELKVGKCDDVDVAVSKIKKVIDQYLVDNQDELKNKVIEKHKSWVIKKGYEYRGILKNVSRHRTNNCYSCKNSVDNSQDIECATCNWIVCSYCGACGCGYTDTRHA